MDKIKTYIQGQIIFSSGTEAYSLYEKSNFGEPHEGSVQYSLVEAIYLLNKDKIEVFSNQKKITKQNFLEKCRKIDKKIDVKYIVFKDLRDKGYIVKSALKFGADFRVYDKGEKPKDKHAKWIVFTEHESKPLTWHDFSAKNRVAHSTKKNLLLGIVDEEGDITYYEVNWIKT
jgi:tRNA-intron endonuclease